jgi:hypothetical protein
MNTALQRNRLVPPADGSVERSALRVTRLSFVMPPAAGIVMGNRAFVRAWAARRAMAARAAGEQRGSGSGAPFV